VRHVLLFFLLAAALPAQDADAHLRRARELLKSMTPGKLDAAKLEEARQELKAAIRLNPTDTAALVDLAKVHVFRREYDEAVTAAGQALRVDPKHLEAQLTRASALIGAGKPGVARLFLQDALGQYPGNPDVLFNLGLACLADRRLPEAEDAYQQLRKVEPQGMRGLQSLVRVYFAMEDPERALRLMQEEAAKAPDRVEVQRLLAVVAVNAKKYDQAIDVLKGLAGKSEKPNAEIWALLGDAYSRNGDSKNSADAFRRAHQTEPNNAAYAWTFGAAADSAGLKKEAEAAYRDALRLRPDTGPVLNNLAYLLADTGGDVKEALKLAQRARELMPTNPEISDTLGWIYLKSGMPDAALAAFQALVARYPSSAAFRFHYAVALAEKGRKAEALPELKRALEEGPTAGDRNRIQDLIQRLEAPQP
jgi:tetratricopeptide (TPR) repeat protein